MAERKSDGKQETERTPLILGRIASLSAKHEEERGRTMVSTIRLSRWYLSYCAGFTVLSVIVVLFLIIKGHKGGIPGWIVALDGVLTAALVLETIVDMVVFGKEFWKNGWNWFDLITSILAITCFVLMVIEAHGVAAIVDEDVAIILLVFRYTSQTARVLRYIGRGSLAQHHQQELRKHGDVRFSLCESSTKGQKPKEEKSEEEGSTGDTSNRV